MSTSKQYDIFISYRRDNGEDKARILNQHLSSVGYRVFFDHEAGMSGEFETEILAAVEIAPVFIMLLTPNCLDRCVEEGDWVRREIERATKFGKDIIPVRPNYGFEFDTVPDRVPDFVMRLKSLEFAEIDFHKNFKATADSMVETMINKIVQPSMAISKTEDIGARIHFFSDISCRVMHFGNPIAVTDATDTNMGAVVRLLKGRHKLEYKSIEHEDDAYTEVLTISDNDSEDFVDILLQPIKDKRKQKEEELRIVEERKAAEEKQRRSANNYINNDQYEYDLFFCYSRQDASMVRHVYNYLQNAGYRCWLDMDALQNGEEFMHAIADTIDKSKCFLFFHSAHSDQSAFVKNEVSYALTRGIKLITIKLDNTEYSDFYLLHLGLRDYFSLTNREDIEKLSKLIRDLDDW